MAAGLVGSRLIPARQRFSRTGVSTLCFENHGVRIISSSRATPGLGCENCERICLNLVKSVVSHLPPGEQLLALRMGFDTVWTATCRAVLSELDSRNFNAGFDPILLKGHRWILLSKEYRSYRMSDQRNIVKNASHFLWLYR